MNRLAGLCLGMFAFVFSHASSSTPIHIKWTHADPTIGIWTTVYVEGLRGVPITGWDLRVRWSKHAVGGEEIGVDFWEGYIVNLYASGEARPVEPPFVDFGSRVFQESVRSADFLSEESKAMQLAAWDFWDGRLALFDVVFAANLFVGCKSVCEPRHLSFSGSKIYGEGGKLLFYVPEPSTLALLGLGLAGLGFARRRKTA